ncbi:hypothetical protein B0F90DRAFT_1623031 [Multifurca ochricompacta]|uniref:Mitochondrial carrier protein n=1 Tax=Multifurca ochricompacta TaxID=376703 RepID=A0AAD4MAF4_9AGAM|nr:hypothetical protein B0F90DRAFT_1623031 [Multifurca ochricompacta]
MSQDDPAQPEDLDPEKANSAYAALARTLTRGAALYFSRPVRLFRPSKISGWQSLRGLATSDGASLSPNFIKRLIQTEGVLVIPKHFVPPLFVNAVLGTVLWTAYSECSSALSSNVALEAHPITIAAISGAIAGGAQAVVAAPAENVRLAIEGGTVGGWSHAWKEVLRGTVPNRSNAKGSLHEIRQVRSWMKEVRDMAGRGWSGWGWGLAKDVCGFSVFFAIFDVTRRVATELKVFSLGLVQPFKVANGQPTTVQRNLPRIVHGVSLVAGGVAAGLAYEIVCRPWDVARKLAHLDRARSATAHRPRGCLINILAQKVHDDGLLSFFRNTANQEDRMVNSRGRQRLLAVARTLGRVGPWGVGFLVWEAFGPGIS